MKRLSLLLILVLAPHFASADLPPYSRAYDPARNPSADGQAALQLARQTGRRVLIEVGGDWCSWCHVLDRFLVENPTLRDKLYRHFVVLKVNVSDENDNEEFMAGLPKPLGYPHLYVSDSDGRILYSKDTAELLENGRYSTKRFNDFIDKWKKP